MWAQPALPGFSRIDLELLLTLMLAFLKEQLGNVTRKNKDSAAVTALIILQPILAFAILTR